MHKKSDASQHKEPLGNLLYQIHKSLILNNFMFCQFCGQRKQTLVPQGFAAGEDWISTKLSTASVNTSKTPFGIKHLALISRGRMN